MSEQINQHRSRFFSTAAMTIAATQLILADVRRLPGDRHPVLFNWKT